MCGCLSMYLFINTQYIVSSSIRKGIFNKMVVNNRPNNNKKNRFSQNRWRSVNGKDETGLCFLLCNEKCVALSDVTGGREEIKDKKWRQQNLSHLLPSRYDSSSLYFSTEVAATLELEEDFLHKSSLSRALCVPVRVGSKWRMVREKRWEGRKNHGANEKGQNILGFAFYHQLVSHLKEEVLLIEPSVCFETK